MRLSFSSLLARTSLALALALGAQAGWAQGTAAKPAASAPAKAAALIDLNSASEAELTALNKIGPVRAKAIVDNRPYKRKDELLDRKIISKDVYDTIKDQVIARQKPAATK